MGLKLKSTGGTGSVQLNAPDNHNPNTTITLPSDNVTGGQFVLADGSGNVNIDSGTLFVDASADRVGIGTTSPSALLDCEGNSSSEVALHLNNVEAGGANTILTSTGSTYSYADVGSGTSWLTTGGTKVAVGPYTSGSLQFINGDEKARIDSSGNFAIGNPASAAEKFHVEGGGIRIERDGGARISYREATTGNAELVFRDAKAATDRVKITSSGQFLVGQTTAASSLTTIEAQKPGGGSNYIRVQSGAQGSNELQNGEEVSYAAVGYTNSNSRQGKIGAYKHSGITNAAGYIFLDQQDGGNSYLWSSDTGILRISGTQTHIGTNSGSAVGAQTSDERLKNVGENVAYGLSEVLQLQPKQYAFKTEPDTNKLGFIAQEVQSIIPEAVFDTNEELEGHQEGDSTKLGMEYVQLIPVLVNAIKEQQAMIETLETQNASFEARLAALEGGTTE